MAIEIPSEPKVYTTVYDNFKGVDYTNDPSNVFKRRSPNGKNMLPDLDGRPYKRTGWEIAVSAEEFCTAAGIQSQEVIPDRTHHFDIGGTEYLMIFNSAGVFYMTEETGIVRCRIYTENEQPENYPTFPPEDADPYISASADRSFYFEGNGIAGFYTFVGLDLYRFDGSYYHKVAPYVPVIMNGVKPSTGSGTTGEDVNMLTEERIMEYLSDGTADYALLERPNNDSVKVEVKVGANWAVKELGTDYTISGSIITFAAGHIPAAATGGEDNVRITYKPTNGAVLSIEDVDSALAVVTSYYNTRRTRTKTVITETILGTPSKTTKREIPGSWSTPVVTANNGTSATIKLPNLLASAQAVVKDNLPSGTWHTSDPRTLKKTWGAYNASLNVTATGLAAKNYDSSPTTVIGSWVQQSSKTVASDNKITNTTIYKQTENIFREKKFSVKVHYPKYSITGQTQVSAKAKDAFMTCRKALNFGNGLYNQMFLSSATEEGFRSRAWYSAKNDPSYFPDRGYIEVGSDDTGIVGMTKIGSYLGLVKAGSGTDSSVYFAYATTFDNIDTFAVRQGVNGIGAISAGAFNLMNGEPLFLSKDGIIAIEVSDEETDRRARNRSWFINEKLVNEPRIDSAVSYVYKGMYFLSVNDHCYVLDGSQKSSWANEKTNLQYECYFLENIPAQCFAGMNGTLYFNDFDGNLCRFKTEEDENPFRDQYSVESNYKTTSEPVGGKYSFNNLNPNTGFEVGQTITVYARSTVEENETIYEGMVTGYTITEIDEENQQVTVAEGVAIDAVWSTLADDDGMVHFFKNLQKKGCVVSLLPAQTTSVLVYLKPDSKERVFVGRADTASNELPFEFYIKKKIKKYKRLQIICENNELDQSFGIDQIIKSYTVGNYSKNR